MPSNCEKIQHRAKDEQFSVYSVDTGGTRAYQQTNSVITMLVYNLNKPFAYDALASTAPLHAVFRTLNSSYLTDHWSSVRTLLQGKARAVHVAGLEEKLCIHDPTIPARVDAWLTSKSKIGAAKAEKTFPPLQEELLATDAEEVLIAWLYWKYSNDFLGVGKGLSDTFIEKLFGDASLSVFFPKEQWLQVAMPCPYCGGDALLNATGAKPRIDYRLNASIACSSCGHVERAGIGNMRTPSSLECDCVRCSGVRDQAAQNARQLTAATITSFASEIRRMVQETASSLTAGSRQRGLSELGQRFMAASDANPSAPLVELIQNLMPGRQDRRIIHPFEFHNESWKLLPDLVADGLVDAYFDVGELPQEDQGLVETTIRGRDNLWRGKNKSELQVHALTTFILGPKSSAKEHVKSWFDSAQEIGMLHSWSVLPLTFQFAVNRDRLGDLARGKSKRFMPETVYIYRNRYSSWTVQGSERLLQICDDLKAPKGLKKTANELMTTVRCLVAPEMARKFEAEFLALAPDTIPPLNELHNLVRAHERLRNMPSYTPVGRALAKYLYWSMCREVIGEEKGVALQSIMDLFGCQKAEFAKYVDEVSVPHACPCCGAPGNATNARFTHPHRLDAARYTCHACGHTEAFGIEHLNQLTCQCSTCSTERDGALTEAKALAVGITERLIDGASKIPEIREWDGYIDRNRGGLEESTAMSYAQLRLVGRSPHECAHLLFEGSIYESKRYGEWPVWAAEATRTHLLIELDVEVLSGAEAHRFARESLNILLGEIVEAIGQPRELADVEKCLISDSGETFAQGIEMMNSLLQGGFLVPQRQKCLENVSVITELAESANAIGMEPSHIAEDQYWYKKLKRTVFAPRHIPAWKT